MTQSKPTAMPKRLLVLAGLLLAGSGPVLGALVSDVRHTVHNLSTSNPGLTSTPTMSTVETQVCVFCHTPHAATPIKAPLWNKALSGATYTPYTSSSLAAETIYGQLAQPGGSSKLCLSCHDGTLAVGAVNVVNGQGSLSTQGSIVIPMENTGANGTMPVGAGAQTGATGDIGTDLTNDHPISLTYDQAVANANGELAVPDTSQNIPPGSGTTVAIGTRSKKPLFPLEPTGPNGVGQIQCGTCHDPHVRDDSGANAKFLRANRLQQQQPTGGSFNATSDSMCLACHPKAGMSWAYSAHANSQVATATYNSSTAALWDFPSNLPVWQASCLNCHDSHTVQGARWLLREGTDSTSVPKSGGNSAIEQTCYQCHTTSAQSVVTATTSTLPDIRSDFAQSSHMPITSAEQPAGTEVHAIGTSNPDAPTQEGIDGIESKTVLGNGDLNNRHAECSDCHNPHRVVKFRLFNGYNGVITGTPDYAGTHNHTSGHTNIASGVLRGAWGVEPSAYTSTAFGSLPTGYTVKRGDPGTSSDTSVTATYVTREYQICLKCHSDYGFGSTPPSLGSNGGGASPGTNGLYNYTNQAMEFQAPIADQGEVSDPNSGAGSNYVTNNHRSWHPVMQATGRSALLRNMASSANLFMSPWDSANIGTQTMYCSDCHGSDTGAGGDATPIGGDDGNSWGPHGSTNAFILKGPWSSTTGQNNNGICFKCHSYTNYATATNAGNVAGAQSGFGNSTVDTNLHAYHALKMGRNLQCMWCHTAVPHGWKNKGLLVNLNDVGPEAGQAPNTEVPIAANGASYTSGPYYSDAVNKVITFATSGNWQAANCGSAGSTAGGNNTSTGKAWMDAVCMNPP
jgi:Doubled CXXCH motif (Paired_CXXCH_1)